MGKLTITCSIIHNSIPHCDRSRCQSQLKLTGNDRISAAGNKTIYQSISQRNNTIKLLLFNGAHRQCTSFQFKLFFPIPTNRDNDFIVFPSRRKARVHSPLTRFAQLPSTNNSLLKTSQFNSTKTRVENGEICSLTATTGAECVVISTLVPGPRTP